MTDDLDDEEDSECERLGHRAERVMYEDATTVQWYCDACGAEWWDDKDDVGEQGVTQNEP